MVSSTNSLRIEDCTVLRWLTKTRSSTSRLPPPDSPHSGAAAPDPDLGQASLEISEASGRAAGERHLRESEVEENIEEGKKETKGWWPF